MTSDVPSVDVLDDDVRGRFHRLRYNSRQRQELEDLSPEEFLMLLLDVWELHLDRENVDPEVAIDAIDAEPAGVAPGD